MSHIIEFMGLPGSGKSTLARGLLKELRRNGPALLANEEAVVRCLRRRDDGVLRNVLKWLPYRAWEPVAGSRHALAELHVFSSAHPSLFALVFEMLSRGPVPLPVRQCVLYALYLHCAERQLLDARLRAGEGVIVEEGLVMGLLALLNCLPPEAPYDADIARFIRHMPAPFGLVWIDTDPSECAVRLARGRHGLELAFAECERQGIPCRRISNSEPDAGSATRSLCEQARVWAARLTGPQ
jgi:hypothetical protein